MPYQLFIYLLLFYQIGCGGVVVSTIAAWGPHLKIWHRAQVWLGAALILCILLLDMFDWLDN